MSIHLADKALYVFSNDATLNVSQLRASPNNKSLKWFRSCEKLLITVYSVKKVHSLFDTIDPMLVEPFSLDL